MEYATNHAPPAEDDSARLLSLREIAAWQVEYLQEKPDTTSICAVLPALQRSAVWSAAQTEALWDSLVRGFPVGAFLLAHFHKELGEQEYKLLGHCSNGDPRRTFHLLDGQQRATGIALGFFNIWDHTREQYKDGPALWVDLALPSDERVFVFRVLTRSHPWGYRLNDPKSRLSNRDISDAMDCFRVVSKIAEARSTTLPLQNAWPWDAVCPLPIPLLIESVAEGDDWRDALCNRLRDLPMWHDDAVLKEKNQLVASWQDALDAKKVSDPTSLAARLERLMMALRRELGSRRIPGLVLPKPEAITATDGQDDKSIKDAVETLFVRINSAGTNLGGEELIYSLLKSSWQQAPDVIKGLQTNNRQVISPARMVTFLARLDASWHGGNLSDVPPQTPSVTDFRKTMRSEERREHLLDFVKKAQPVIADLLDLVLLTDQLQTEDYRLPPTLTAQLFGGERGLDSLMMVSVWLMRLHESGNRLSDLSAKQRQRTLGFIVSVNWFAEDVGRCLRRLWPVIQQHPSDEIKDFFNRSRFRLLLPAELDGNLVMLPLVPPDVLDQLIKDRVTSGCPNYPGPNNVEYWVAKNNWTHYNTRLVPDDFIKLHTEIRSWIEKIPLDPTDSQGNEDNSASRPERRRFAWYQFLEKLWSNRRVVDYAQRAWIVRWFHDFDPTLPGQMDDLNRPWDYDHIHPQSLGSPSSVRRLPAVIREWHTSIGNLRAWPLELNRGDQNDVPAKKLDTIDKDFHQRFQLINEKALREASFIGEKTDWPQWQKSTPDPIEPYYLLDPKNSEHRIALIRAITTRFRLLYRKWYQDLALNKLM